MSPRKIILDCDPGQDDAVALFLAMSSPDELEILGITTVAGNVPLELTQRNARMMCDIAGKTELPVFAGCERPTQRESITAEHIHGRTGIDGVDVFEPATPLQERHAVDFIIASLLAAANVCQRPGWYQSYRIITSRWAGDPKAEPPANAEGSLRLC